MQVQVQVRVQVANTCTRASVSAISESVADENHLYPYSLNPPAGPLTATVSVPLPTSLPPLGSVIHWPDVQNLEGSLLVRPCQAEASSPSRPRDLRSMECRVGCGV